MSQTVRTTLEQGRAKYAYECAEKGKEGAKNSKPSEYKAYAKKIPMLIKTNGLGATMAFAKSKNKTYQLIYEQIAAWIKDKELFTYNGNKEFVEYIVNQDSPTYRALTIEVLAFFNWLRRFADGLIKDD